MGRPRSRRFWLIAVLACLGGCEQAEKLQDRFRDLTPYEEYQASLAEAGLAGTALAKDWARAGLEALVNPVTIALPFQETGYITPERPVAITYWVTISRGRKLTFEVSLESSEGTRLFTDLFRVPEDAGDPLTVFSSDSVFRTFAHEPWRGGDFILRVQPELLRGGTYRVTLRDEAQLEFPVGGRGMGSIQSVFGAARDGGRREHHGIDIFAPRGTPVLAASAGRTRGVRETSRGGKVIWIRDPVREASLYYAHLDSQHVGSGQLVERGDTIGFVGNTGNARTTPPHLHFGLYRRGPVDPWPFLDPPRDTLAELTADVGLLGVRVRPVNDGIRLRAAPGRRGEVVRELDPGVPLRVLGASGGWFRVGLPDGSGGFVAARLMEPIPVEVAGDGGGRGVGDHPPLPFSSLQGERTPDRPVLRFRVRGAGIRRRVNGRAGERGRLGHTCSLESPVPRP